MVESGAGTRAYLERGKSGWIAASDRRLKENIINLPYGLNDLMKLRATKYKLIDGKEELGFIAQEVKLIFPEIVSGEETDSTYLGLFYDRLTPILTKATQEQQEIIENQAEKIKQLEEALATKNTSIEKLEKTTEEQKAELTKQADELAEIKKFIGFDSEAKK